MENEVFSSAVMFATRRASVTLSVCLSRRSSVIFRRRSFASLIRNFRGASVSMLGGNGSGSLLLGLLVREFFLRGEMVRDLRRRGEGVRDLKCQGEGVRDLRRRYLLRG